MQIYFFMSTIDRKRFAYTLDRTGSNLPPELGPREEAGTISTETVLLPDVLEAIRRDGFYLDQVS